MTSKLLTVVTTISLALTPFLFWTLTPNFFSTPKQYVIIVATLIAAVAYFVSGIRNKAFNLPKSSLTLPLIAFMVGIILNLIINSEGRTEAIAGGGSLLLALPVLSLLILSHQKSEAFVSRIKSLLMGVGLIVAIHSLLQLTLFRNWGVLPAFMQNQTFTPTGSFLTSLTLIAVAIATTLSEIVGTKGKNKPLYLTMLLIMIIASVAITALMMPGSALTLNLIPYNETWAIALDALKSPRSLLFGVGLANYSLLYTAVKPLSLNATNIWNLLPQSGSSELLTLVTTGGIILGLAMIYLMITALRTSYKEPLYAPLLVSIIALIVSPGSIVLYLLFFVLLAVAGKHEVEQKELSSRMNYIIGGLGLLLAAGATYVVARPLLAEYHMRRAQIALAANDGQAVYEAHQKAIILAPGMTSYHLSFAEVNLSLASALSQKSDISETDRNTITQLISQAINESKNAISLRGNYSLAWHNLGKIYRNLINVAEGADRFAIDYYARAIALDPANPVLRVEYGGLFYQLSNIAGDEATKTLYINRAVGEFQTAAQLRPSYANAHYNLAKLLETRGDIAGAYASMQQVVANLDSGSSEYTTALSELETLKAKLPKASASPSPAPVSTPSGELTTPSPLPSPLPGGPLEIEE